MPPQWLLPMDNTKGTKLNALELFSHFYNIFQLSLINNLGLKFKKKPQQIFSVQVSQYLFVRNPLFCITITPASYTNQVRNIKPL